MMSIALPFYPDSSEETDKIMKAQMARGADFESGNGYPESKRTWCRFLWCRCLFQPSAVQMIWRAGDAKHAATMEEEEHR